MGGCCTNESTPAYMASPFSLTPRFNSHRSVKNELTTQSALQQGEISLKKFQAKHITEEVVYHSIGGYYQSYLSTTFQTGHEGGHKNVTQQKMLSTV